ncbi:hypothetical protein RS130_22785 [Paraglaciecola aquimarina]|uniref:Uncharacterized protein n=1 Tax=Paraglaciecola aquimarina TaxID=1235557 RepID=A0ABU3T241_9ALTE|nr:hypothetical protein [Paraglaciecola aquimarina]MDU0356339.1 hypothetical protein [Paraglaciecola aquimarina]
MAGSIVASSQGSEALSGACTKLVGASSFSASSYNVKFKGIFGDKPFKKDGTNGYRNMTLKTILQLNSGDDEAGINDVNIGLVVMYLNAANHGNSGIYYTAAETHGSLDAYAKYLYAEAKTNPATVGALLSDTIAKYSSLSTC